MDKPGYRAALLRRTYPQLQEIMDRCWRYYTTIGGEWAATEKRWYFPGGDATRANKPFVALGHMQHENDKYNYQGKEFHFAGLDELTQFTETQYLYFLSRIRTTDPSIPTRVRSTTNPGGIGHAWVKRRFVDAAEASKTHIDPATGLSRCFIPGKIYDNPTLIENDPGYLAKLEALPETERKRLLHGDWDVFEGQFFPELDARKHLCDPFDIPPEWTRICAFDWGFAKPFAVLWGAIDYDDTVYLYREWYGHKPGSTDVGLRMVAADVADGIQELEGENEKIRMRVADPSIWNRLPRFREGEVVSDNIFTDMAARGVVFLKGDNNREQGWQQVQRRVQMDAGADPDGEVSEVPRLQVFSTLKHFWRTMTELQADPNNPEDANTKMEDHIPDAFRYLCMMRPIRPKRVQPMAPPGSFKAERNRYIRAKDYARKMGVSLEIAYRKIR